MCHVVNMIFFHYDDKGKKIDGRRHEVILAAAAELSSERGYVGTFINAIATAAGIRKTKP